MCEQGVQVYFGLNELLIPNDGFNDVLHKNWLLLKIFYKKKFTASGKLAICKI